MIVDCISDLHGFLPELEGGDLLIVAGDLTARDTHAQYESFYEWLSGQNYQKKVVIAGNHDGLCCNVYNSLPLSSKEKGWWPFKLLGTSYLCDSGCEFDGLKIWGSPWTPEFCNWHFMLPRGKALKEKWDLIPADTDILITHGPPLGIMDATDNTVNKRDRLGCAELRDAVERVKPRLHVFGHIHGGYGQLVLKHDGSQTVCVNAAIMDEGYRPRNKPIRVQIDK
jgi:3',5'-cyclic AMP phosphodiesterase CpdA